MAGLAKLYLQEGNEKKQELLQNPPGDSFPMYMNRCMPAGNFQMPAVHAGCQAGRQSASFDRSSEL